MMQGIGGYGGLDASEIRKLFSRIDANNDGKVTRDEFVAGASENESDTAGRLFDALAGDASGSLDESDILSVFQQMHDQTRSALLQQQGGHGPRDPKSLFERLDSDGDGTLTREEFVAGRPESMSEEDANAFFDRLDDSDAGSLSAEQFAEAMADAAPPPPPGAGGPPPGAGGQDEEKGASMMFDKLDTNQDGVVSLAEWLAGRPDEVSEEEAAAMFEDMAGEGSDGLTEEQFAAGMQANRPAPPMAEGNPPSGIADQAFAVLLHAMRSYERSLQSGAGTQSTTLAAA